MYIYFLLTVNKKMTVCETAVLFEINILKTYFSAETLKIWLCYNSLVLNRKCLCSISGKLLEHKCFVFLCSKHFLKQYTRKPNITVCIQYLTFLIKGEIIFTKTNKPFEYLLSLYHYFKRL